MLNRVGRVLSDLSAGRQVADIDLLQHRNDCRVLMQAAAERWQDGRESRETVERWQSCFLEAMNRLSPAWKAQREAEALRAAEGSGCYFLDAADAARVRVAGGHGG